MTPNDSGIRPALGAHLGQRQRLAVAPTRSSVGLPDRVWLAAFALSMIAFVAAPSGDAYTVQRDAAGNELAWDLTNSLGLATIDDGVVRFHVGASRSAAASSFTGGISEYAAIRRGLQTWNDVPHAAVAVRYAGIAAQEASDGSDDENVIYFDKTGALDPSTLAITTLTTDSSGRILDADIAINDNNVPWNTLGYDPLGAPGRPFLEAVIARQVGEALGLDRSFVSRAALGAPIGPGSIRETTLHSDDQAGLAALYPLPSLASERGEIRGSVTTSAAAPAFGVQVAALRLRDWTIVAGALTDAAGDYRLRGLEPGEYWLVAAPIRPAVLSSEGYAGADTEVFPAVHGVPKGSAGAPSVFAVFAGGLIDTGADFVLEVDTADPFAPHDTPATSTPLALGEAAVGRLSGGASVGTFRIDGVAPDDELDLVVVAHNAGSTLDPRLTVIGDDETTVLVSPNVLDPAYVPEADDADGTAYDANGYDLDPRLRGWAVPGGEGPALYAQIDAFGSPGAFGWYLVAAVRPVDDTSVSPFASTIALDPPALEAGLSGTCTVTVETRNRYGTPLGNVAAVELDVEGTLVPMTEAPAGSGVWQATLSPLPNPGAELIVAEADGVSLADAVTLHHAGPADPSASSVVVRPGAAGLFADGVSRAYVSVTPRDANGAPRFDDSHIVSIESSLGSVGSVGYDAARGAYVAELTAPSEPGTATIETTIDGVAVASAATLTFDLHPTSEAPNGDDDGDDSNGRSRGSSCGASGATGPAGGILIFAALLALSVAVRTRGRRRVGCNALRLRG